MILVGCIFGILTGVIQASFDGQCVMRTNCGIDEVTLLPKPCVYNGFPVPLNDELSINTLKDLCPSLKPEPNFSVCCDAEQVATFSQQIDVLATFLKRCPSCFHNLANLFCQFVCSPTQSSFLKVSASSNNSVDEISYYITEKFVTGLFDSCKEVKLAGTSFIAMHIMCGQYGKDCSPHLWLEYLGNHDPSPYQINFHYETSDNVIVKNEIFYPMNETIIPCSEPVNVDSTACSHVDCP